MEGRRRRVVGGGRTNRKGREEGEGGLGWCWLLVGVTKNTRLGNGRQLPPFLAVVPPFSFDLSVLLSLIPNTLGRLKNRRDVDVNAGNLQFDELVHSVHLYQRWA